MTRRILVVLVLAALFVVSPWQHQRVVEAPCPVHSVMDRGAEDDAINPVTGRPFWDENAPPLH